MITATILREMIALSERDALASFQVGFYLGLSYLSPSLQPRSTRTLYLRRTKAKHVITQNYAGWMFLASGSTELSAGLEDAKMPISRGY